MTGCLWAKEQASINYCGAVSTHVERMPNNQWQFQFKISDIPINHHVHNLQSYPQWPDHRTLTPHTIYVMDHYGTGQWLSMAIKCLHMFSDLHSRTHHICILYLRLPSGMTQYLHLYIHKRGYGISTGMCQTKMGTESIQVCSKQKGVWNQYRYVWNNMINIRLKQNYT